MALTSSIHRFDIEIADVDRGVYTQAQFRLAVHPSETVPFALVRVLAYALELREGLSFGPGLCEPNEPALSARDPSGALALWVEVGSPSAERLHRAAKLAPEVAIYTHKLLDPLLTEWRSRPVHRAEHIRLLPVPRELLEALEPTFARTNTWTLLRTEGVVYVTTGERTYSGALVERRIAG
jgi:uncharacterized protein YaeQ